ncbi:MAG TPA: prepilin-type N-terminal cleavage/methylation domain-containing protein [bacterium]|nr:prepilin-type N-terminal cleavage/methylation domain-containing protein [bacterium]
MTPSPAGRRFPKGEGGFSLVEMLVALAILAVLAAVAVPYSEAVVKRDKETELRLDLREMREAIDRFHEDWQNQKLTSLGEDVSRDGYPKNLGVLVRGLAGATAGDPPLKYLRRVPENPFGDPSVPPDQQWALRGYRDAPDSRTWGGRDVYDVYCPGDGTAMDGSPYRDW